MNNRFRGEAPDRIAAVGARAICHSPELKLRGCSGASKRTVELAGRRLFPTPLNVLRRRPLRRLDALPRPHPGRRLPEQFRVENVGRIAESSALGLRDPAFEQLIGQIDAGPIHKSNKVELYTDGDAAFASILEAVEGAAQEILLETYILKDDALGHQLVHRLERAAARGVTVRVLADAFGSWATSRKFWRRMREMGIEARLFHPFGTRFWDHIVRDHRKILVVDRSISFVGGMNVGNEYGSSRYAKSGLWRDSHARVEGSVAWELAVVFREGWTRAGGAHFFIPPLLPSEGDGPRTLVLDSRPGRGYAETASVFAAIVGAARERLWITNSYFAPRRIAIDILGRASRRGVDVRLLLPGISDVPIVRHAGHGFFNQLLKSGVRVFEYQPAVLHAKTLVADDCVTVIGSSNLDFRSFHFNAECNIVSLDVELAGQLAHAFKKDLANSVEITSETWGRRSIFHRVADTFARSLSPLL